MKSKYNRAIVYDLETGGLSTKYNSITEVAMVAIDLENLTIIDEMQVVFEPRVDIGSWMTTPIKDAKTIYKNLSVKDAETNIKALKYKSENITLKNIEPLVKDITEFYKYLELTYGEGDVIFNWIDIEEIEKSEFADIFKVFFDNCYNPQALEVTGINRELLEAEGLPYNEAYNKVKNFIDDHTVVNSKPIIVGHNVGSLPRRIVKGKEVKPDGFDNPFMEILFNNNNDDWFFSINDEIIDTLKWARLKWAELSNFSLGTCANEVGLTLKEAHRALPDTVANAKLYIKMMEHLRGQGSEKSRHKRRKFNFQY